ncbi:MAG: hypothetical protein LBC98_06240 [Prevotellaceae bacterium]|jgi:hypothetical protein|nr:hypothetical protein [Prevotellaceae bacterium]
MARIKSLKKDIDFLMNELITDCQLFIITRPEQNSPEAEKIINQAVELWNQLYERTNNPDGKHDRKLVRQHYKSIEKDLLVQTHEMFAQISALAAKD